MTVYRRALAVALLALAALLPSVASALTYTSSNGRVVFSTGSGSTTPSAKPYTTSSSTFGAAIQLPAGAANQAGFVLKNAPLRDEYLAGYVTTAGVLYVLRYNGATSSWSSEWSATVGGDGVNGRRFDIAYEKLTGRGLVAYSSGGSNQSTAMRYRIWNPAGGRWGTEQSFGTLQLGGTANWVKLASRPGTNQLAVGVMDTTSLLSALIWDGSAWGNEPAYTLSPHPLPASLTAGDLDSFDLAFGSLSGDLMLVWPYNAPSGGGWSYQYYNQYQAATGSWFPSSANWNTGNGTSTMWQVVLAADPLSDQIGVVLYQHTDSSTTTNSLLQRIWTGSAWTPFSGGFDRFTNASGNSGLGIVATTSPNQRPFTAFWLNGAGTAQLVVPYSSATINGNQLVVNKTGYSVTAPALPKVWFQSVVDPSSPDRAMVSFSDSGGGSWAKRVVLGTPTAWLDDGSSAYQGSAPPLTNGAGLSPPTNLTLTSGSGSLAGGTYFYRITATNAAGETLPSTETSLTLASTGGVVLTWTDADGGVALTSALASTTSQSFAFDYDHPPITVFGDYSTLEAVTGSPACAATATSSTVYDLDHFTL